MHMYMRKSFTICVHNETQGFEVVFKPGFGCTFISRWGWCRQISLKIRMGHRSIMWICGCICHKRNLHIYIFIYIYVYYSLCFFILINLFILCLCNLLFFLLCICLCIYIYILEVTWIWLFKQQKYWIIMRSIYWGHLPTRSSVVV